MSDVWYLFDGKERSGPLSLEQLQAALASHGPAGELRVWRKDFSEWRRVADVPELRGHELVPASPEPASAADKPVQAAADAAPRRDNRTGERWAGYGMLVGLAIGLGDLVLGSRDPEVQPGSEAGISYNAGYVLALAAMAALIGFLAGIFRDAGVDLLSRRRKDQGTSIGRPPRFQNFVARNWRGEFPLWVSFWIFVVLVNLVVSSAGTLAKRAFRENAGYEPGTIFAALIAIWLLAPVLGTWQFIGVWRSANRRIHQRKLAGKRAPWAVAAKVAVVIGAIHLIGVFANAGVPQLTEVSRLAFMDDPGVPPYALRIMRNGTEVEITGGIKYGLTDDFVRLLGASPRVRVVHLNSVGGRLGEAKKLNKTILERKLITYVSSYCNSACTVAFVAGHERWIHERASLGFHSGTFPGLSRAALVRMDEMQRTLLTAAGVEPQFIGRALSTPNEDMWTPSIDELRRANVITAVSDGSQFAVSGFGPDMARDHMVAELIEHLPLLEAVRERFPRQYAAIIDDYYQACMDGQTEAEVVFAARQKLMAVAAFARRFADDAVLIELGKLTADQYKALGAKDAKLCYHDASGKAGAQPSDFPPDLRERDVALVKRIIATAAERPAITDDILDALRDKVWDELVKRSARAMQNCCRTMPSRRLPRAMPTIATPRSHCIRSSQA